MKYLIILLLGCLTAISSAHADLIYGTNCEQSQVLKLAQSKILSYAENSDAQVRNSGPLSLFSEKQKTINVVVDFTYDKSIPYIGVVMIDKTSCEVVDLIGVHK